MTDRRKLGGKFYQGRWSSDKEMAPLLHPPIHPRGNIGFRSRGDGRFRVSFRLDRTGLPHPHGQFRGMVLRGDGESSTEGRHPNQPFRHGLCKYSDEYHRTCLGSKVAGPASRGPSIVSGPSDATKSALDLLAKTVFHLKEDNESTADVLSRQLSGCGWFLGGG